MPARSSALRMGVGSTYGKFFLLKKLAAGGMGEIFLARQQGPAGFEKVVVIKRILSHLTDSPEYLESFLQEARLQARMNHSAVVQIFDLGQAEEDGSFYLAMEYVHGKSLHELIQRLRSRNEPLPPALASTIIERVAEGLSYAHNLSDNAGSCLNIIHRDISPHNVLVSYTGDVKLIDFGIAKSEINTHKTEAGTIKGKFFYMSPEQSAAQKIDKRSDIFSLGIVAYEALTGENPFWRANVVQALEAIQKQDPAPLSYERPELAAFDRIIGKALAKDPDERYEDATDFKDALTAARVSLGPPAEKLGPLLQRVFKDKVEQENRLLVDTDSASLPLKQQSSSKIRLEAGKKPGSESKPRPKTGDPEVDALQREPTPVVELPPRKLIESAQTKLVAPAKKLSEDEEPEGPQQPADGDAGEEEADEDPRATLVEGAAETFIREPLPTPVPGRTPAPTKAKTKARPSDELEVEQPERPTLEMDAKADEEDAAAVAKMKGGKGPLYLAVGVAALVLVGAVYGLMPGGGSGPIEMAQPLKPDPEQPLKPPPTEDRAEAVEEAKAAEDAKKTAEAKKAEEAKAAADAKKAAEEKKAEEAKAAADAKKAAEEKKAEEAKAAAEAKKAADAKKAEEARAAAEAKKAADAKKAEEAKAAAEAKKAADAKKAEEAKAAAEAKKAADAKKAEEAKAAAEAKKAADAKKAEEAKARVASAGAALGTLSIRMASPATLKLNGKPVDGAQVVLPSAKGTLDVSADGLPLKISVTYSAGGAQLNSDPWAIAYVNGISKGKTPLSLPFDAEPRRIRAKRPGLDQPVTLMWKFSK
ncbi:MAG: protein kinase [Myxococcales bacterium]